MSTIEDAIALAAQAHRGQLDKAGRPYILHPLRMMLQFDDEEGMVTAVLHDVIEDNRRLPTIQQSDCERLARYSSAWGRLASATSDGADGA